MAVSLLPEGAPVLDPMDPNEITDIQHDFERSLGPTETITNIAGVAVVPVTVPPLVVVVSSVQASMSSHVAARGVTSRMQGGVSGTAYVVTATPQTNLGRQLPRSVILPVQAR